MGYYAELELEREIFGYDRGRRAPRWTRHKCGLCDQGFPTMMHMVAHMREADANKSRHRKHLADLTRQFQFMALMDAFMDGHIPLPPPLQRKNGRLKEWSPEMVAKFQPKDAA